MRHSANVALLLSGLFSIPVVAQQTLFEDHFPLPPADLSKWTGGSAVIEAPGVVHTGYQSFIHTVPSFQYVNTTLEMSADMLTPDNGYGQSTTDIELMHPLFSWRSLAVMGLHGSTNGESPNTLNGAIVYGDSSSFQIEGFDKPFPGADGWHNGKIIIRPDGRAEFYIDSNWLYTSTHSVVADYGQAYFMVGGWNNIYDNAVVATPEPATLSLLMFGGLAVLRRRR